MAVSPGFIDFVVEQLEGCGPIVTKRMFGGVGIYSSDTFFAIIDNDILYLKVDDTTRKDFEREGCRPFRPYGDERETMQDLQRAGVGYSRMPTNSPRGAGRPSRWLPRRNPGPGGVDSSCQVSDSRIRVSVRGSRAPRPPTSPW